VTPAPGSTDQHVAITDVKLLTINGKKADDRDVVVNFFGGQISVTAKNGGAAITTVPYRNVVRATYIHAKDPKYDGTLPAPPDGLELPGGLFGRPNRHWLVAQTRNAYAVLYVGADKVQRLLETLEARTGVRVDRPVAARGGGD
jgi:hypothetical protein